MRYSSEEIWHIPEVTVKKRCQGDRPGDPAGSSDECHEQAKEIILEHQDVLHQCAALLLKKEKVHREEFETLFTDRKRKSVDKYDIQYSTKNNI